MRAIDVSIPEGYEYSHMAEPVLSDGGGILQVVLKKKKGKTFDFYVDEYLRSDNNTTNDMLCNWFDDPQVIEKLKDNLKQNKLIFVPWDVKIGLVKFMCKDMQINFMSVMWIEDNDKKSYRTEHLKQILPIGFLESITK